MNSALCHQRREFGSVRHEAALVTQAVMYRCSALDSYFDAIIPNEIEGV
jgi:hypothetical protein